MKLVHCLDCGDVIRPLPTPLVPRSCICGRHSAWWADERRWRMHVHDARGARDRAFLFRITNRFMNLAEESNAQSIRRILDGHPDTHHFRTQRSPIVKSRIGKAQDASWADLPVTAGAPAAKPKAGLFRRIASLLK